MAHFLFIVARQLPDVYDHLCRQFGREPNVEVILDRRKEVRRDPGSDRRRNGSADEQLRAMGYAFVKLED